MGSLLLEDSVYPSLSAPPGTHACLVSLSLSLSLASINQSISLGGEAVGGVVIPPAFAIDAALVSLHRCGPLREVMPRLLSQEAEESGFEAHRARLLTLGLSHRMKVACAEPSIF